MKPKPTTRYRNRAFRLDVNLPCAWPLNEYAWDVINSIERETIDVVDPRYRDALVYLPDPDGVFDVNSDAQLPIRINDWLAVGCQRIRWEKNDKELSDRALGAYCYPNIDIVFGTPFDDTKPLGPAVFVGEIVLPLKIQDAFHNCSNGKKPTDLVRVFQFIIAHELVHVFDTLKYLAPAFIDWRAFWKNVLNEGERTDVLYTRMSDRTMFVDNYGDENELERIRHYWPSRADGWFQTRRLDWDKLFEKGK